MRTLVVLVLALLPGLAAGCTGSYSVCFKNSQHPLLNCSGYNFTAAPCQTEPTKFSGITTLDLSNNRITELTINTFAAMTRLSTLILDSNLISVVHRGSFNSLTVLKTLSLKHNHIDQLPNGIFTGLQLETLDLSFNTLTLVFPSLINGLTALTTIDLSNNALTSVYSSTFATNVAVKTIRLANNHLQDLTRVFGTSCTQLQTLDISHNNLERLNAVDVFALKNLRTLDASHNALPSYLAQTFATLTSLRTLDLSHNALSYVSKLSGLPATVTSLDLSHNAISSISGGFLGGLSKLNTLHLDHNTLTQVPARFLHGVSNIRSLTLHSNAIRTIDATAFHGAWRLSTITLYPNALGCCDVAWRAAVPASAGLCATYSIDGEAAASHCASCAAPSNVADTPVSVVNTTIACAGITCPQTKPAAPTYARSLACSANTLGSTCPLGCQEGFTANTKYAVQWTCGTDGQWHTQAQCINKNFVTPYSVSWSLQRMYMVSRARLNWTQAEATCVSNGGHLASITSLAEANFLSGVFLESSIPLYVWIGLTSAGGSYAWSDGGVVTYSPADFDTAIYPGRKCMTFKSFGMIQTWLAGACEHPRRFICEFPL